MSLNIKDFLIAYVKPNALKLGGEVSIPDITSNGGPVVPSTAKFYLPDFQTFLPAIFDISDNYGTSGTASYSSDVIFSTFTASNVTNLTNIFDMNDLYTNGFYNENIHTTIYDENILTIGYTGVFDFQIFNEPGNPLYNAGVFTIKGDVDLNTYDINKFVQYIFDGEVSIDYFWGGDDSGVQCGGIFSLEGGSFITFRVNIDYQSDTVDWSIGNLGP